MCTGIRVKGALITMPKGATLKHISGDIEFIEWHSDETIPKPVESRKKLQLTHLMIAYNVQKPASRFISMGEIRLFCAPSFSLLLHHVHHFV